MDYNAIDYVSDGMIVENIQTSELLFINRKAKVFLKVKDTDVITRLRQFLSGDSVYAEFKNHIKEDIKKYDKSEGTIYLKSLDSTFLEVDFYCTWIDKENNAICYTLKNVVEVVGESDVSFKELAEHLPSGIIVMNIENGLSITYANSEHYKILGIQNNNDEKKYLLKDFIFEEDAHWVLSEIYLNLSKNENVDIEFRMKSSGNIIKWVRLHGRASMSNNGENLFYSSLKDLSERRSLNDKLHLERILFHKITELTNEVLFRLDLKTNIIYFLGSQSNLFSEANIYENYPESLSKLDKVHDDDMAAHDDLVYCFQNGIEKPIELRYLVDEKADLYEWYRISYSFIKDSDGTPISAIGKMANINTQKILEERSKTDLLTGFYNKISTEQEIDRLIYHTNEKSFALFIIDIDNFKEINDNLGHHFGDMVLSGIADDIRSCFRKDDILGRIGGDEFIVVMRNTGNSGSINEKANLVCETLSKSFSGATGNNYDISASIGISMYPSDGTTFEELYQKSDRALYEIKATGKNGYKQYYNDLECHKVSYTPKIRNNDNRAVSVLINNTIMVNILNLLYESKDLDATIFLILEYMGKMFKLDKCFIFESLDNGETYNDSFSWFKDKNTKTNSTRNMKKMNIDAVLDKANEDGVFYTNNINTIGDEWTRTALEQAGAKSVFLVDSQKKYNERGIFFAEDCTSERVWSGEEVITLLHANRLIFTALNRHNIIKHFVSNKNNDTNVNYIEQHDNNNSKISTSLSYNNISNSINNFYLEKDHTMASVNMVINIVNMFQISKATSVIYNDGLGKYFKSFDYTIDGNFGNYSEELDKYYKTCVNTLNHKLDDKTTTLLALFKGESYIYCENFSEIKEQLKKAGYVSDREDEIIEIYIFAIEQSSFFGYIVFERYNENKLSDDEKNILTSLCRVLNANIESHDSLQKYKDDILIKNTILNNENIPIAVIEKESYKVLYHNELYYDIAPNIAVGKVCYQIFGYDKKCEECCLDKDLLMNDANHEDHQWIKKSIPFTLNNGVEAYMIYSKDSIDYINQVNALDNLTQSLLLRGFEEYYKNFIKKSDDNYALCVLDIDKFKYINEIFDYKTGDRVLSQIATVIRNFISIDENFCRLNEDKFAILLNYSDEVNLHTKIKNLSQKLDTMRNEHFTDTKITVSGGVTLVDKTLALNTLLDQSTIARKSAKGSHKNNFVYYNPEIDIKIKQEIQLEEQIPYAIENDEFVAYLQPKFNLNTKKICGAEALVRWVTPKGKVFPDQFIPLFERNGFILTLDFIVYDKVMQHIRKCLDNNMPVYPISVNVSRNHIKDENFLDKFMSLINKYKIPYKYLELEITESVFVEDMQELKDFVGGIKDYKLKVSIDDFGTAYSSLQNLTDINVDILKIDKGFLDNIDMSNDVITKDEILLKNIINLAKELDFHVICEGVETDRQVDLLKKIGCEYGQGYVFARPMPIEDYEKQFLQD